MDGDPDTVLVNMKYKNQTDQMELPYVLPISSFRISFLLACAQHFPEFEAMAKEIQLLYRGIPVAMTETLEELGVRNGDTLEVITKN